MNPRDFGFDVWCFTLTFNRAEVLEKAIDRMYATRTLKGDGFHHVFSAAHYPINKKENHLGAQRICEKVGGIWLDPGKNLGLHDGFEWAFSQVPMKDNDIVLMYDPDNWPIESGWDEALVRVLKGDPRIKWACLNNPSIRDGLGHHYSVSEELLVDGIRASVCGQAMAKTVQVWDYGFLKSCGGVKEPTNYYGHWESVARKYCRDRGVLDVFLPDYLETSELGALTDPVYYEWKVSHAHQFSFKGDLEAYLHHTGRSAMIGPQ